MDRAITRYAPFPVRVYCLLRQPAIRAVRSSFSTTSRTARKKNWDWRQSNFPKKNKLSFKQQQEAPESLRFRLLTDTINHNLSSSVEEVGVWIKDFLKLSSLNLLDGNDCTEVVRILHNLDRNYRSKKDPEYQKFRKELQKLVDHVRQACQSGSVPSTSRIALHLLSYYKESGQYDKGLEYWDWLSKKDEAALDPIYVGAALELLAVYGAGIDYCEDVYERTLAQQKDISSQYYLSPGPILPDRSKEITIKGTSLGILQGILSARLFYGKWQRSYLTLDTAFLLRPTQIVPRVLDLFVYERPLFEALPVFFMYCRGGNAVSKVTVSAILKSLQGPLDQGSHYDTRIQLIQAMLHVVEAHLGSAGSLDTTHLNMVVSALCTVMPSQPTTMLTRATNDSKDLTNTVMDLFAKLFEHFAHHSAPPGTVTFEKILSKALSLGYPDLATVASQDMMALRLIPRRSVITKMLQTAVRFQNPELVKAAWACIHESSKNMSEDMPDPRSWKLLAAAARRCGLESFVESELQLLIPERFLQIKSALQEEDEDIMELFKITRTEDEDTGLDEVQKFEALCTETCQSLIRMKDLQHGRFRDFRQYPVNEPTAFTWPTLAKEHWERKLYDELTYEEGHKPSDPALLNGFDQTKNTLPAISDTGVPFDELRYENWKTVNNLLVQAEAWERRTETSADAAIQERRAPNPGERIGGTSGATTIRHPLSMQQFEAYRQDVETEERTKLTEEAWRSKILRLRDSNYESRTHKSTFSDSCDIC